MSGLKMRSHTPSSLGDFLTSLSDDAAAEAAAAAEEEEEESDRSGAAAAGMVDLALGFSWDNSISYYVGRYICTNKKQNNYAIRAAKQAKDM